MANLDKSFAIAISKAPEDPGEKKDWVNQMMRIQVAMWLDDKCVCLECKHKYESVDDFMKRSPTRGHTKNFTFVCEECYPTYKSKLGDMK